MLHAVARGQAYECFVRPDTRIPFMAMPDAIRALLMLEGAQESDLSWRSYNVTSFNPSAEEFLEELKRRFPVARVTFVPHLQLGDRGQLAEDVNDEPAREIGCVITTWARSTVPRSGRGASRDAGRRSVSNGSDATAARFFRRWVMTRPRCSRAGPGKT
jgi:hypothetical protein